MIIKIYLVGDNRQRTYYRSFVTQKTTLTFSFFCDVDFILKSYDRHRKQCDNN